MSNMLFKARESLCCSPCPMQSFHGVRELFSSDHNDPTHKITIMGKCNVLSLEEYEVRK